MNIQFIMKQLLIVIFYVATMFSTATASQVEDVYIIPRPQTMHVQAGHYLLARQSAFTCNLSGTDRDDFVRYLENSPLGLQYQKNAAPVTFRLTPSGPSKTNEEGYQIVINPQGIKVEAASTAGLFYAFQSLLQLAQPDTASGYCFPLVEIKDYPRFSYRGLHLDVSRHFRTKEFVKKQLDALARYKLNRFHWHLTDGAGWRIEIEKYPELTHKTAYRPFPDWKSWSKGGQTYCTSDTPGAEGGYYTKEDIREVVEYARERHITIIPEIEMPGHSEEVLVAYPQLACEGLPAGGEFCPGREETFTFLTSVLTEVMELFPSEYIHIGGDEASTAHWKRCTLCQKRMHAEGLKDESELQAYLISRIEKFLQAHNRKLIGWDEILSGDLSKDAAVTVWRSEEKSIEAVRRGLSTVMSPGSYCYLDGYQDAPATQPEAIGGYLPLQRVYSFEPIPAQLTSKEAVHIWGVQANVWTEYIPTAEHAEYMIYPRLLALAEVAWTQPEQKDWKRFHAEALSEVDKLRDLGYHTFDLKNEVGERPIALAVDNHKAKGKKVNYITPYSEHYPAGGNLALTDGLHGGWTYGDNRWQGFLNSDAEFVIDLEKQEKLHWISADFMQLIGPYVWLPKEITISVSSDGREFVDLKHISTELPVTDEKLTIQTYAWNGDCIARYIRINAKSNGMDGGWLFVDEIVVK